MQRFGSKRPILHLIGKLLLQENYSNVLDMYLGSTSRLEHVSITKTRLMFKNNLEPSKVYDLFPRNYLFERLMLKGLSKGKQPRNIVFSLPKYFLRLSISAYQSFVFNKLVSSLDFYYPRSNEIPSIPLIGYKTDVFTFDEEIRNNITKFLAEDGLHVNSFKHENKFLSSKGTERFAIVKPENVIVKYVEEGLNDIIVSFNLPKGAYATMFLREIQRIR